MSDYNRRLGFVAVCGALVASIILAPPASTQSPDEAVTILGPGELRLGTPARFVADGPGPAAGIPTDAVGTYSWDLDGERGYEVDTGRESFVGHSFPHGGPFEIGVEVRFVLPDQTLVFTATHEVNVTRPPLVGLEVRPPNPRPGDKVRLRLETRSEEETSFVAYVWDFDGLRPKRTSLKLPTAATGGASPLKLSLKGAQPTLAPKLTVKLPARRKKPKAFPLTVVALDNSGNTTTLHSTLLTGPGKLSYRKATPSQPVICDDWPASFSFAELQKLQWRCADVGVFPSYPATKVKTLFTDATPSAEACLPKNVHPNAVDIGAHLDLPYPAPTDFGVNEIAGGQSAGAGRAGRRAGPARGVIEEECATADPITLSWEFGDGTTLAPPPGGALPPTVSHVYQQPGTYSVTLTTKVPILVGGGDPSSNNLALKFFHFEYFVAKKTIAVEVLESHCGTLKLNGIPASSVPRQGEADVLDANGCFVKRKSLDGKKTLFQPLTGYQVDLNTIRLGTSAPPGQPPSEPLIDTAAARLAVPVGKISGQFTSAESGQRTVVEPAPAVEVPQPEIDPEIGEAVAPLPVRQLPQGSTPLAGLAPVSSQALLSPAKGAFAKFWLKPPPPINGVGPAILGGGPGPILPANGPADETDFDLLLDGLDLGLFKIEDATLGHRINGGGFFGGATLSTPFLAGTFAAPYKPPPASSTGDCETIDGPSGISISSGGDFEFGGFTAKDLAPPVVIGPLGLDCVAIAGQTSPFVMVGKVGGRVPPGGPFSVDGCFLFGVLPPQEPFSGCAGNVDANHPEKVVWMRSRGSLGIFGELNLANGWFDYRAGPGTQIAKAGGGFHASAGPFYADGGVSSTIQLAPSFAFDLIGGVEICKSVPVVDDPCADVEAGVSSKGFGACFFLGGFVHYWNDGTEVFFFSCDLKSKIGLSARSAGRVSARAASATRVPTGMRKVGFEIHGEGGAPIVAIRPPGGRVIADDGQEVQIRDKVVINHFEEQAVTAVTVRKPKAGRWRFDVRPGSPPIDLVRLHTPIPEPRVTGRVSGKGSKRVLNYRARLAKGDRLSFEETGRGVARRLGKGRAGKHRLRFPIPAGKGRRTVRAIVERNGIPYTSDVVARYWPPKPSRPARPQKLRARNDGMRLLLSWQRVRRARRYETTIQLADGRGWSLSTRRPRASVDGIDDGARGIVRTRAVGRDAYPGPAASIRLRPDRGPVSVTF